MDGRVRWKGKVEGVGGQYHGCLPHQLPGLIIGHVGPGINCCVDCPANDAHAGVIEGEEAGQGRREEEDQREDNKATDGTQLAGGQTSRCEVHLDFKIRGVTNNGEGIQQPGNPRYYF